MFVFFDGVGLIRGAVGGVAIAVSSSLLLFLTGRHAGMSGIIGALTSLSLLPLFETAYVLGLLCAGAFLLLVTPSSAVIGENNSPALHWLACILGGLAIGFGTRLGSGCTSGHGIVGLARLSPRSLVAVMVFFGTGIVTAGISRASFLRGTLYGAEAQLPPPLGTFSWSLSSNMYIVPLIVAIAASILLHFAVAAYRSTIGAPSQPTSQIPSTPNDHIPSTPNDVKESPAPSPTATDTLAASISVQQPQQQSLVTSLPSLFAAWVCGLCFGLSLGLSGMLDPSKVLRFLDILGDGGWDPQLILVMGLGVATNLVLMRFMTVGALSRMIPPLASDKYAKPLGTLINYGPSCKANRVIDFSLIVGSMLFGWGWGLTGVCPGPAIVDYVTGGSHFGVVVPSILFGMVLHNYSFNMNIYKIV